MTAWDKFFQEKIRIIARGPRVLDIGGGGEPFQKQLSQFRELFNDTEYIVIDKHSASPSIIAADAHHLPFPDQYVDGVICKSVLEHVEDPFQVVREIRRVLKKGAAAFIYVPFLFPYHANVGVYADFWRFTADGVRYLFKDFSHVEVVNVRGFFETLVYFIPFLRRVAVPFARILDALWPSRNQTSGFNIFVIK